MTLAVRAALTARIAIFLSSTFAMPRPSFVAKGASTSKWLISMSRKGTSRALTRISSTTTSAEAVLMRGELTVLFSTTPGVWYDGAGSSPRIGHWAELAPSMTLTEMNWPVRS